MDWRLNNVRADTWERYRSRTEAILKTSATDENRVKVLTAVRKHVDTLESLRQSVA